MSGFGNRRGPDYIGPQLGTWLAEHAPEEHIGDKWAQWTAADGYPRYQLACACGWHTGVAASRVDAYGELAEHCKAQT